MALNNGIYGDGIRFLIAGAGNTLLTLGVYYLCLFVLSHDLSYAISWLTGITILVTIYPDKVFPEGRNSLWRNLTVVIMYVLVFLFSLCTLNKIVNDGVNPRIAIVVVLLISTVLNFFSMRLVLRGTIK